MVDTRKYAWLWWAVGLLAIFMLNIMLPPSLTVTWKTETENNTAGFHLYRLSGDDATPTQITPALIVAQGNSSQGASYRFKDGQVKQGKTYTYLLEEIELDGTAVSHHTFQQSHTVPLFKWWTLMPIIGLGIFYGSRLKAQSSQLKAHSHLHRRKNEVPKNNGRYRL